MITSGIHNVSSISKVAISPNPNAEQEGWISLTVQTHSEWTNERSTLEITLFCKDIASAVSELENGLLVARQADPKLVRTRNDEANAIG